MSTGGLLRVSGSTLSTNGISGGASRYFGSTARFVAIIWAEAQRPTHQIPDQRALHPMITEWLHSGDLADLHRLYAAKLAGIS
jgi:hypothetical protein